MYNMQVPVFLLHQMVQYVTWQAFTLRQIMQIVNMTTLYSVMH
jgi:DNA polymerase II small subunit/DNA polymerase delta subunit B